MAVWMRAAIMLILLVGLPAAWVYYGPLPSSAQRVVDRVVELAQDALGRDQLMQPDETMISAPRYQTNVAAMNMAAETPPATTVGVVKESSKTALAPGITLQVEPLLQQLRGLGVSEYSLEKWGSAGQLYRFRCAMPLAKSDEITRQFEAVANDPLASIEQVVGEVASWQTARRDGPRLH